MSTPFPDPITKPYSNTGDNATPPLGPSTTTANQETGYPVLEGTPLNSGGIPVTREETNGVMNFYSKQILALVSGCRFTFNQALSNEQTGYPMGAVLYCASNNSLQMSLIDNNTFNFITTPSYINDGVHWSATTINDLHCNNIYIRDSAVLAGGADLVLTSNVSSNTTTIISGEPDDNLQYILPNDLPPALAKDYFLGGVSGFSGNSVQLEWFPTGNYFKDVHTISVSPTTYTTICQLTLTYPINVPVYYELTAVGIMAAGVSSVTNCQIFITTTPPPAAPTDSVNGDNTIFAGLTTSNAAFPFCISNYRVSFTLSQTYYLVAYCINSTVVEARLSASFKSLA